MATYVIADIHGEYDKFVSLLKQIDLKDSDTLYILGDVVDRGPHPIKVLKHLMQMHNAFPIVGNHELMAVECLSFLCQEITEGSVNAIDAGTADNLYTWADNGSSTTIEEFRTLTRKEQQEVIAYIREFILYEELMVNDRRFLLVHAGLGNYDPSKSIEDYSLKELIWDRADYDTQYFKDTFVVTGHTPTQLIHQNPHPGYIYRANNHIAIDCGACFHGGRLAAIRLDDGMEYYEG